MTTVAQLLLDRGDDDHVALRFEDQGWTWRQVVERSAAWAAWLGRVRRDGPFHIGVLLENVPEYLFVLGAAALTGATVVGINPTRRGAELAADIRHTDCQVVVTDSVQRRPLEGLDIGLPGDRVFDIDDPAFTVDVALPGPLPSNRRGPAPLSLLFV